MSTSTIDNLGARVNIRTVVHMANILVRISGRVMSQRTMRQPSTPRTMISLPSGLKKTLLIPKNHSIGSKQWCLMFCLSQSTVLMEKLLKMSGVVGSRLNRRGRIRDVLMYSNILFGVLCATTASRGVGVCLIIPAMRGASGG